MEINLKRVSGIHFEACSAQGHKVNIDGPPKLGGQDAGTRPMELVLMGLAGCASVDVVMILEKQRQVLADLDIQVTAERADTVPSVFTRIHLKFSARGGELDQKKFDRAVGLSVEKYCSVVAMLEKTAEVSWSAEIESV